MTQMSPILLKNYSMYDLIPLIATWLEDKGFQVSILANRIEGVKRTGFFSSEKVTVFLEDYPDYCSIKLQGSLDLCTALGQYLRSLPPKEKAKEREVIIKEREVVSIPCPYCGTLVSLTERKCPNCGAYIRG